MAAETETETRTFAQRMGQVMAEVGALPTDKRNDFHGYGYTSAASAAGAIQSAMARYGLYVSNHAIEILPGSTPALVWVRATVTVSDGEHSAVGQGLGCGTDKVDKAPMKADTAAYKYAICSVFCVGKAADPEADSSVDSAAESPAPSDTGSRDRKRTLDRAKAEAGAAIAQRAAGSPAARSKASSGPVFRFGQQKGTPLSDSHPADLEWYRAAVHKSAHDPGKEQYWDANLRHLAEIDEAIANSGAAAHHSGPAEPTADEIASAFGDDDSELPF